jgi:hypothetical protein
MFPRRISTGDFLLDAIMQGLMGVGLGTGSALPRGDRPHLRRASQVSLRNGLFPEYYLKICP